MSKKCGRIARPAGKALAALLLILTLANSFTASGLQRLHNPIQLTSPNPQRLGHFGLSVATDGREVVVGAWSETGAQPFSGRAYVFDARTGELLFSLASPNPNFGGAFGWSVAIDSGLIVVGAPEETIPGFPLFAGRAYVFDATTGNLIFTLSNPDPSVIGVGELGVSFGSSVAVGGDRIVVGTFFEDQAFVFSTATKNLMFTLGKPFAVEGFGGRIAVEGGLLVIASVGNVYAYNATDSDLVYTLSSPKPRFGNFGSSVAVGNGLLIVGANLEMVPGRMMAGNAYAFNATTGRLLFTLAYSNPQKLGIFGVSVAVDQSMIFVGSFGESSDNVCVYNAHTGGLLFTLSSPNSETGRAFGSSLSAAKGMLVVGAYGETVAGHDSSGNAYVF